MGKFRNFLRRLGGLFVGIVPGREMKRMEVVDDPPGKTEIGDEGPERGS